MGMFRTDMETAPCTVWSQTMTVSVCEEMSWMTCRMSESTQTLVTGLGDDGKAAGVAAGMVVGAAGGVVGAVSARVLMVNEGSSSMRAAARAVMRAMGSGLVFMASPL
jgi:hypothetical protein